METEREETEANDTPAAPVADAPPAEAPAPVAAAAPAAPAPGGPPSSAPGDGEGRGPAREGSGGDDRRPRGGGGRGGRRRRVCIMCADHMKTVDYKNVSFLRRFISDRGRIDTRRKTSACAKHQRAIATGIKRARHLALLPYTAEHIRSSGVARR